MNEQPILSELLGLPHTNVTSYQLRGTKQIELSIESTLAAAVCPTCGQISEKQHELGKAQTIRDLTMWQRRCHLLYRPRRFKCQGCKDTFVEQVLWREVGVSYTLRYEEHLYQRARREALSQIAQDEGVSEDTVRAIFERWAKKTSKLVGIRL